MTNPYAPDPGVDPGADPGVGYAAPVEPTVPNVPSGVTGGYAVVHDPGGSVDTATAWQAAAPADTHAPAHPDASTPQQPASDTTVRSPFDGPVAVRVVDVEKTYGLERGATPVRALDHVSIDLPAGRFTAIMGPSGSGKSTLLQVMAGLDTVTSGQIFIGDTELTALDENGRTKLRRDQIGFVFQAYNLVSSLTARENIVLPARLAGRKWDEDWLDELVRTLGLGERMGHKPTQMSGGQQQRVAAARALLTRPDVIFGDEPTGALDSVTSAELLSFLQRAVTEHGQTIVIVTHDPFAASHADWVVFLADGKIVDTLAKPTPDDVLDTMRRLGR